MKITLPLLLFILLGTFSCKKVTKREIKGTWNLKEAYQEVQTNHADGTVDRYTTIIDETSSFVEYYGVYYSAGVLVNDINYTSVSYAMELNLYKNSFTAEVTGTTNKTYSGTWTTKRKDKINKLEMDSEEFDVQDWELDLDRTFTIMSFDDNNMEIRYSDKESTPTVYMQLIFTR